MSTDANKNWIRACAHNDLTKMIMWLDNGAYINFQNEFGQTALILAAQGNKPHTVSFLLSHQANVHIKDARGNTALHAARHCDSLLVPGFLLDAGSKLEEKNNEGLTIFAVLVKDAAIYGNRDCFLLDFLLNKGADVLAPCMLDRTCADLILSHNDVFEEIRPQVQSKLDKEAISAKLNSPKIQSSPPDRKAKL